MTVLFGSVSLGPTYRLNYPSGGFRSPKVSLARGDAEIAHWLEKLGLGQYAQRFAENDITSRTNKEIGVSLSGVQGLSRPGGPFPPVLRLWRRLARFRS
jgi:SAM domain (Sterile alpha motif)